MKKIKYHYLYKITCVITKKYYIGVHSTDNLNDGYLGSGELIIKSVLQHGKENHILEILKFYNTAKEKYEAEKQYITKEMILDPDCLNISLGGCGGIVNKDHLIKLNKGGNLAFKEKLKDPEFKKAFSEKCSLVWRKRYELGSIKIWKHTVNWTGKKHKKETIEKQKETFKKIEHSKGSKNSQYGTMWITNGKESKRIKKYSSIPKGWKLGRVCKKSSI